MRIAIHISQESIDASERMYWSAARRSRTCPIAMELDRIGIRALVGPYDVRDPTNLHTIALLCSDAKLFVHRADLCHSTLTPVYPCTVHLEVTS